MEFHSTPHLSRRALLETFLAAGSLPLLSETRADAQVPGVAPRPFRVDIPQATIDRILKRVRDTRWPDRLEANDWRYGANWDYMKSLAEYWTAQFEWRKAEANLNRYPQFLARISEFDIHFYHVIPVGAVAPVSGLKPVWPARFAHACEDAVDGCLRNVHAKGPRRGARDLRIGAGFRQQWKAARCKKRFEQRAARQVRCGMGFHVQLLAIFFVIIAQVRLPASNNIC